MKILLICEFFPSDDKLIFTGGVESYNFYLARELAKKNKVTIICRKLKDLKSGGENVKWKFNILRLGKENPVVNASFWSIPSRILFVINAIKVGLNEEFDIVQGNNFVTYLIAFVVGSLKRKPTIAWYPDVFIGRWISLTGFLSGVVGELIERIYIKLPWSQVIALSGETKEKLIKNGARSEKISQIYAGVDNDFFNKIRVSKNRKFTICVISRLMGYKRVDLVIKVAKKMKDKKDDFNVVIIGDGPEKNDLEELIRKYSLEKNIEIYSKVSRDELVKKLKESNLLCFSSTQEGFGLVLIEAAAAGVPYIASDIDIFKEITRNGRGGMFFKSENEHDLYKKIDQFRKNGKLQRELKLQTKELVRIYSWEKVAEQFMEVYQSLQRKNFKILMMVDAWFPHVGGGQIHVWELSKRLADLGNDVTIYTRNNGSWQEIYDGVEVLRVGVLKKFSNPLARIEYLIRAIFYALSADYEILHLHAFSPGLVVPLVKIFRNKKIVYTVHGKGLRVAGFGFTGGWLEKIVTYQMPYDLEITVAKNTLINRVKAKKLKVIPNGVDLGQYHDVFHKIEKIEKIIFIGRLSYDKGVDILIGAFKKLNNSKLHLNIIGDGEEMSLLRSLVRKGDKVFFTGRLSGSKLKEELKQADLIVLPSRTEGQPLVLLEAWAAKIPILATRVGDNTRFIKDEVNGFLVDPNEESLAGAIRRVIQNKNIKEIVEKAYFDVQQYSWEKVAEQTFLSYQELYKQSLILRNKKTLVLRTKNLQK